MKSFQDKKTCEIVKTNCEAHHTVIILQAFFFIKKARISGKVTRQKFFIAAIVVILVAPHVGEIHVFPYVFWLP